MFRYNYWHAPCVFVDDLNYIRPSVNTKVYLPNITIDIVTKYSEKGGCEVFTSISQRNRYLVLVAGDQKDSIGYVMDSLELWYLIATFYQAKIKDK